MSLQGVFRRAQDLVLEQLKQGTDPRRLALAVVLGALLGIFPILGATTSLCLLCGAFLRLNQPLMQAVNFIFYPLQLVLFPVFLKAGTWVFGGDSIEFDLVRLKNEFLQSIPVFMEKYAWMGLKGIGVWFVLALLILPIGVLVLEQGLRRWVK